MNIEEKDPMAEARKDPHFKCYSDFANEKIKLQLKFFKLNKKLKIIQREIEDLIMRII